MKFHEKFECGLKSSSISVKQMAKRLGVAPNTVYTWLKGGVFPALDHAAIIAQALELPLEFLADDKMEKVPGPPERTENRRKIELLIEALGEDDALNRLKGIPPALHAVNPESPPSLASNSHGRKRDD